MAPRPAGGGAAGALPGGAEELVSTSAGHLFQLLRGGTMRTRRELIRTTGLSRSTVTHRVDALLAAGYATERGVDASTGGRRPSLLAPNYAPRTILAADLGATHGRLAVMDGAGVVLAETALESRIDTGPAAVLGRASTALKAMVTDAGREPASVCGIGIAVPGPVDVERARLVQPPIMPGWHDYPIREFMAKHFDAPVLVDNDANLMALGETRRHHADATSLLFVKVATGIGAGLVLDQQLFRGTDGGAGDLGHVKVPAADGVRCTCGAQGCLAAVASGAAVAAQLAELGWDATTSRDVVRLVQDGHPDAVAATRRAGRLLGEVLATAISLLNPSVVVLGGDMALTHEHFLLGLRESIYQRTQPLATRSLTVARSRLGDQAGIQGIAAMICDEVFSAAAVDRAISAADGPASSGAAPV
ncbi:MAG: ROK family transcriptional regulator [bacterium]